MKSRLLAGWFSSGRIHLPSLLLPLLTFSATFPSKPDFPEVLIHQVISSLFMLCALVVFFRSTRSALLAAGIPLAIVLLRFLRVGLGGGGAIEVLYFIPYAIVMLGIGTKLIRDYPVLMLRQVVWICGLSATLALLQIMGVQWAQSVTNLYSVQGGTSEWYLFVAWKDLPAISSIQARPTGFAAANNVGSQYLLFFYGLTLTWFVAHTRRFVPPWRWMFIVAFACALSGAKVVIAGVILLSLAALLFASERRRARRALLVTVGAYACYAVLFPGLFIANFNIDLFAFNMLVRMADLTTYGGMPYVEDMFAFLGQYHTGEYIGQRSVETTLERLEGTAITGIGTIYKYLTVLGVAAVFLAPLWIVRLRQMRLDRYLDMRKAPIIMLVALLASIFGGPFIFSTYFWFFFSFVLYPLSIALLRKRQPEPAEQSRGVLPAPAPA